MTAGKIIGNDIDNTLNLIGNVLVNGKAIPSGATGPSAGGSNSESGYWTPPATTGFTFSQSYWTKVDKIVSISLNFTVDTNISATSSLLLPNSFSIDSPIVDRVLGFGTIMTLVPFLLPGVSQANETSNPNLVNIYAYQSNNRFFTGHIIFNIRVT